MSFLQLQTRSGYFSSPKQHLQYELPFPGSGDLFWITTREIRLVDFPGWVTETLYTDDFCTKLSVTLLNGPSLHYRVTQDKTQYQDTFVSTLFPSHPVSTERVSVLIIQYVSPSSQSVRLNSWWTRVDGLNPFTVWRWTRKLCTKYQNRKKKLPFFFFFRLKITVESFLIPFDH